MRFICKMNDSHMICENKNRLMQKLYSRGFLGSIHFVQELESQPLELKGERNISLLVSCIGIQARVLGSLKRLGLWSGQPTRLAS
jgi:hypothetical protein